MEQDLAGFEDKARSLFKGRAEPGSLTDGSHEEGDKLFRHVAIAVMASENKQTNRKTGSTISS